MSFSIPLHRTFFFSVIYFVYVCLCFCILCIWGYACGGQRTTFTTWFLVLSFHHVGLGGWNRVIRLSGKLLCLLGHLTVVGFSVRAASVRADTCLYSAQQSHIPKWMVCKAVTQALPGRVASRLPSQVRERSPHPFLLVSVAWH